ncbi:leucine--tRNA ligase [Candidatus Saccharibacteria bacterium]|nr:MAG: leucine--tRNA ligase [Candidatus Saccharibacteria bacterium]
MKRYNPKEIEPKWQSEWDKEQVYKADLNSTKPKYIAMSMFNYPSGAGIHIGHAMNYTISDVMARFKRQQGFESYHPVGWDAFGLPAENYAIKAGVSPQQSMAKIIPSYHTQYKAMGWSNDWSKEINTHLPEYYRWTQWIFWKMYEQGMAYQDARMQWWCTRCQTVLANEQVLDGKCWRHDAADDPDVQKREVKQWFFRITDYADELLQATHDLDWSDVVKTAQVNWIGKSEGANVRFVVEGHGAKDEFVEVFTTAHDTIFGTTFMVLAPEHPLVAHYGQLADNAVDIEEYIAGVNRKSELERLADKTKSGVPIEGLYAINPLNGAKIPIWTADYVLMGYGTGAVMGVPGEDERDNEFAKKFGLPIIYTTKQQEFISYTDEIKPNRKKYFLANSGEFDGMDFEVGRQAMLDALVAKGAGEAVTQYKIRDWSVSRQRYWGAPIPIVHCPVDGIVPVPESELPVVLPELEDFAPSGDGRSALARASEWLNTSCPKCGGPAERETDTLDTYICSSWYELRYFDPANSNAPFDSALANKWMPIDFYNGGDHATAHLIYVRFIARFFHKLGMLADPEPFKRFLFNGKVTASDGTMFSKSKGNGVDPLEIIAQGYGADALRTYLMFAAPLDLWVRWDPQGVPGTYRFLNRVWNLVQEYLEQSAEGKEQSSPAVQTKPDTQSRTPQSLAVLRAIHQAIQKVTADLEAQRYNTAIAAMMEVTNTLYALKAKDGFANQNAWNFALKSLVALVAPFAPHIADELWHDLGRTTSVQRGSWPVLDEQYLVKDTVTLAVQVNGKLRGTVEVAANADEATSVETAKRDEKVAGYLEDKEIIKIIYVPKKLISFVVR